ncbi:MAG: VWA domain-containing protein, partial [Polyangiaceae bacterium]
CDRLGFCAFDSDQVCLLEQNLGCESFQGDCADVGLCENHFDCKISTYEEPVVDVTLLPDGAATVIGAIDAHVPDGGTTTLPALAGAIQRAAAWTAANPDHKAIVVLATDGLPTNCDPALDGDNPQEGIQHLVDVAAEGAKAGVQTFVIGVFNAEEQAEAAPNLDAIAVGGGTESAYLISTEANVADEFRKALNEVRITAKSCEFGIPLIDGALPNLDKLVVRITPPNGEPVTVERVKSAAACHPTTGGFYYDTDPDGPVKPGRVILCPASCGLFGTAADRKVELLVSCE